MLTADVVLLQTPQNVNFMENWIKAHERYRGYNFRNMIRDKISGVRNAPA